jgi:glycosyltransferase involved in cell wall biosynthesis
VEIKNSRAVPYEERDGILFVGRLVASKGLEYLISATKGTNEKLSIIGDGPEKKSLMNRASGSDVQFLGKLGQEEVFDHMRKAKALVLPSIFGEGLPNVILEAMSAGAPVISTSVGGIPDVLEDGKTGFVVEPKNVESLRRSILVLIRNKGIWHNIHTNCLSEAKKYSWEQVERKVMEELEKTLQRARQTRFHPGG